MSILFLGLTRSTQKIESFGDQIISTCGTFLKFSARIFIWPETFFGSTELRTRADPKIFELNENKDEKVKR